MKTSQILIKIEDKLKKKSQIYARQNFISLSELIRSLLIKEIKKGAKGE